jgi:hypothetical protein
VTASIVMVIVLTALAWPLVAAAQDSAPQPQGSGPGALWEAYPLEPETTAPATPAAPAAPAAVDPPPAAAPADSDDGLVMMLAFAVAFVALGAIAALAIIARRRGRSGVRVAPAAPPPAPEAPPPPLAPAPAAPAPRRASGAREDALDLARLAADYLEVVAAGSRRPVVDLAALRSWDTERTRRALGRARSRGLLVGAGRGRVGGVLSDEAERLLGESAAAVAQPHDEPQPGPGLVDRADLVVHEPGGQSDLAHDVLGDVGGHAGGPFRPRHPEAPVGSNGRMAGG